MSNKLLRCVLKRKRICDKRADHAGKQPQAPCVHEQQKHLPTQHPAPCLEDVCCGLRAAHRECDRRGINKNAEQDIPLGSFKEQLQVVPRQQHNDDEHDQRDRSVCASADDDQHDGIEIRKAERRQLGRQNPVIRRATNLQDNLDNAFRAVGKRDEDDRAERQLDRMLRFKADAQPVILKQVPDPHQ